MLIGMLMQSLKIPIIKYGLMFLTNNDEVVDFYLKQ